MKEEIKEIPFLPDYHISNYGIVYTTKRCKHLRNNSDIRILKPKITDKGYYFFGAYPTPKKKEWFNLHRMVWTIFRGPIPYKLQIDHIDGDKSNNHIDNLELVTHQENTNRYWNKRNAKTN
jgi:hypothetical protein